MERERKRHGSLAPCDTCNSRMKSKCRHLHEICICFASTCFRASLLLSLQSLLPGCSIIHRQCESGLAQQGAYQLTMYSYRAVKMKRNVDPVNLCTHSKRQVSFQGNSTYICLHTVQSVRAPEHIIRTQCLHTFQPPTQLFLTDPSFFFLFFFFFAP